MRPKISKRTILRGFTLIESLLGLVLITFSLLATFTVIPFSFGQLEGDAIYMQAIAVGQQYLDAERQALLTGSSTPSMSTVAIDAGKSMVGTGTLNSGYGNFKVMPQPCTTLTAGVNSTLHDCSVIVQWTTGSRNRAITVESYVTTQP